MSELLTVEESVWGRCGRRVVTVPLYLLLGTLSVALLPVTIALAPVSDAVRPTGHLVTLRCTLGITLYFTIHHELSQRRPGAPSNLRLGGAVPCRGY